jgi:hypothetical protein
MQVDSGEGAPTRVPGTERYRKPRLFVATLRYSRASFRRVVGKSGQQIWATDARELTWSTTSIALPPFRTRRSISSSSANMATIPAFLMDSSCAPRATSAATPFFFLTDPAFR